MLQTECEDQPRTMIYDKLPTSDVLPRCLKSMAEKELHHLILFPSYKKHFSLQKALRILDVGRCVLRNLPVSSIGKPTLCSSAFHLLKDQNRANIASQEYPEGYLGVLARHESLHHFFQKHSYSCSFPYPDMYLNTP